MYVICTCGTCSGNLEFEESAVGSVVVCPHCGADTALFIPDPPIDAVSANSEPGELAATGSPDRLPPIIVTTGNDVSGYAIESYLGIVRGNAVRAPGGGLDSSVGHHRVSSANVLTYKEVIFAARNEAYVRMVQHAQELAADAVIAMRYDTAEVAPGLSEVFVYGTAVKLGRAQ